MSTIQKIRLWVLMLIGMFILSEFLIYVGLNSNYKKIARADENSEIVVYQAEATSVDGRIRGTINNVKDINEKYLKIELYTKRDVSAGTKYIEIKKDGEDNKQQFELLFRANNVAYYKIGTVNEKEPGKELEIISGDKIKSNFVRSLFIKLILFG